MHRICIHDYHTDNSFHGCNIGARMISYVCAYWTGKFYYLVDCTDLHFSMTQTLQQQTCLISHYDIVSNRGHGKNFVNIGTRSCIIYLTDL
jgi:hypothetical protein